MKKQDKKDFPDRKNYIKLLPAAAVIAAVTVTGVQGKTESSQKVQSESAAVKDAEELTGLLTTAYSYDDFTDGTSSSSAKSKNSSKKIKKGGIKKGTAKTLPDESQKTSAEGQGSTSTPTVSVPEGGYKDGTYQGSGTGFGGTISVQVTISGGKITAIDILSASGETPSYFASAQGVISKILSGQTPNVDAVSGATYSSNGIIQAVQNALSKAANTSAEATPTPTVKPIVTAEPAPKPTSIPKPSENVTYKDGTYSAEAEGFDGPVKVTVTIKKGKIVNIVNTNTDTQEYFNKAWSKIQPAILKKQGAYGVDTVAGATFSSNGILEAAQKALEKAERTVKPTAKPTITPNPGNNNSKPGPTAVPAPTTVPEEPDIPVSEYQDGTYSGRARGYSGFVTITLTIKDGKITELTNINTDTSSFFKKAWKILQPAILEKQSADGIDTVSGATFSSEGILGGARKALESAKLTPVPTETPAPTVTPTPTETPVPTTVPDPTEVPEISPIPTAEPTETPEPTPVPTETPIPEPTEEPENRYRDGNYTGSGSGNYGAGSVTVTVTISGGQIVEATCSSIDDEGYFDDAWDSIYGQVLGNQSADGLDTVSGATFSSQGIIQAFQNALSQAQN